MNQYLRKYVVSSKIGYHMPYVMVFNCLYICSIVVIMGLYALAGDLSGMLMYLVAGAVSRGTYLRKRLHSPEHGSNGPEQNSSVGVSPSVPALGGPLNSCCGPIRGYAIRLFKLGAGYRAQSTGYSFGAVSDDERWGRCH